MSAKSALTRSKKKQARALVDQGRLAEAAALYEKIVTIDRADAEAWYMLGAIAQQAGHVAAAIPRYQRALELDPKNYEAAYYLGICLADTGDTDQAIRQYQRVLALQPTHPQAICNLGSLLEQQARQAEAIEIYERALTYHPRDAVLRYNLGCALLQAKRHGDAIAQFEESIRLRPDFSAPYANLAKALEEEMRLREAIDYCSRGLHIAPNDPLLHVTLAKLLTHTGDMENAIRHYQQALRLQPDDPMLRTNYLLATNYSASLTKEQIFEEHLAWGRRHGRHGAATPVFSNTCTSDRRLRIGYLSPDFRTHSVSYFFEPVLRHHDRERFETVCFSDVANPDQTTERLRGLATRWHDISKLKTEAIVDRIRAEQIDVLVDLAGHAGNTRLAVFTHKPAPVQVTWLGYPNTTGLPTMDYRLTDAQADPAGEERFHTEQLVRLPVSFLCYQAPENAPDAGVLPASVNAHVTFGCFNNLDKITDEMLSAWSKILSTCQNARLFIKNRTIGDPYARECLENRLVKHGIPSGRAQLMGWTETTASHLAYYQQVDIALDTFPYHGTTTTCEALWMGVPVVTLAGSRHAARVGVSLLHRVGLPELVADTAEDYVKIAVALAGDIPRLSTLRASLREQMAHSPLCDAVRFTADLESAYRDMWSAWCRGKPS